MSTPQLPLVLRAPADQRLETFVGNDIAVAALRALAQGDDTGTAYVSGAEASGKTHALLATVAAANEAGRDAAYLPLHAMRGHLAAALDGREAAALVALDGWDAIVGEREDETALFHSILPQIRAFSGLRLFAVCIAQQKAFLMLTIRILNIMCFTLNIC